MKPPKASRSTDRDATSRHSVGSAVSAVLRDMVRGGGGEAGAIRRQDLLSTVRQGTLSACESATRQRKHGVADDDVRHAVRNAMRRVAMADDLVMLIGPASDGALPEIGVLDIDGDDPVVIHAMKLRQKFFKFLD